MTPEQRAYSIVAGFAHRLRHPEILAERIVAAINEFVAAARAELLATVAEVCATVVLEMEADAEQCKRSEDREKKAQQALGAKKLAGRLMDALGGKDVVISEPKAESRGPHCGETSGDGHASGPEQPGL